MLETTVNEQYLQTPSSPIEEKYFPKASLFNLIVVADTLESAVRAEELIQIVTEKFPCNILFVRTDETTHEDVLHVMKTAHQIGSGPTPLYCNQVIIECSKNQLFKAPFLILPEIIQDLPTYLLFAQDPSKEQVILPALAKHADRIIYDIDEIDMMGEFARRIAHMLQKSSSVFIDITWAKIKGWRNILLQTFQEKEKLDQLAHAKTIQICYVQNPEQKSHKFAKQAIYLQAWIAARMQWKLISTTRDMNTMQLSYKNSFEEPVTITLSAKDSNVLTPGSISSIELFTHGDAHFLISHDERKHIVIHASNPKCCEIPFSLFLTDYQKGRALLEELFYHPPSSHYVDMLQTLQDPAMKNI